MSGQTTEGFIKSPVQPVRMELDEKPKTQTVREYRHAQGVDHYDELNAEWRQIVLKKRSCGPTLGKPSSRSLDFFYLSSYDVDGLREFLRSPGFSETYDIDEPFMQQLLNDEVTLMKFGFRILKQVLFGEPTIGLKPDALEKRIARRRAAQPTAVAQQPIS